MEPAARRLIEPLMSIQNTTQEYSLLSLPRPPLPPHLSFSHSLPSAGAGHGECIGARAGVAFSHSLPSAWAGDGECIGTGAGGSRRKSSVSSELIYTRKRICIRDKQTHTQP